jgi:hypothetical protein
LVTLNHKDKEGTKTVEVMGHGRYKKNKATVWENSKEFTSYGSESFLKEHREARTD